MVVLFMLIEYLALIFGVIFLAIGFPIGITFWSNIIDLFVAGFLIVFGAFLFVYGLRATVL